MTSDDLTRAILVEIRDEIRSTKDELRSEVGGLRSELAVTRGQLRSELAATREELCDRITALDSTMHELAQQQRFVVKYTRALAERGTRNDDEIADLRARVDAIEAKLDAAP